MYKFNDIVRIIDVDSIFLNKEGTIIDKSDNGYFIRFRPYARCLQNMGTVDKFFYTTSFTMASSALEEAKIYGINNQ